VRPARPDRRPRPQPTEAPSLSRGRSCRRRRGPRGRRPQDAVLVPQPGVTQASVTQPCMPALDIGHREASQRDARDRVPS
jgi:hypothetical protein